MFQTLRTLFGLFIASTLLVSVGSASSLQDWEFNVNGADYYPANGNSFASVPGLDFSGFNAVTGQGTLTLTFAPGAAGNYYVGAFFFAPVGVPFYNEYGVVNGSPASGQTWQIDVPQYDVVSPNHGPGTIIDNLASASLNGTNSVPGTTDNYLNGCGANGGGVSNRSCNDLVSMALGFNFSLMAGETEYITLTLSTTLPSGFSLGDVHPVDGSNTAVAALYYSGIVSTSAPPPPPPPPPTAPEPASWALLAGGVVLLALARRRLFLS